MALSRRDILKSLTMTAVAGSVLRVIPLEAAEYAHRLVKAEKAAPEFIDLLTSENKDYQVALGGGLMWLDNTCLDRYDKTYLDCTADQQKEILDLIAYRKNAKKDPSLGQGIEFFSFLRKLTADGFFTSEIGINYLGYVGNTFVSEFPGCPPVPGE